MSGMRRSDKEIKERAVLEEILREAEIGRLATSVDGQPYVVPVNFAYRDGRIVLHSHREGLKMRNIAANPQVCFEVDWGEKMEGDSPCAYGYLYRSVIARGTAKIHEEPEKKLEVLKIMSDKYSFGKTEMLTLESVDKFKDLVIVEILVEEMTGKRSTA